MSSYRVQLTDTVKAEVDGMSPATRRAWDAGLGDLSRDPYGCDSRPYPGGGSDDHRMTHIRGVAIITYQVSRGLLLITVVQAVAR
jgi:hypothetical protein